MKPVLEAVIRSLPEKSLVERSVYMEMHRHGVGRDIDEWQKVGLVDEPVDYRSLAEGERLFRSAPRRLGLSREDRASLVLARVFSPAGLLTCEGPLSRAAQDLGVYPVDLFEVVRLGLHSKLISKAQARDLCAPWVDKNRAGRPVNSSGTFDAELAHRDSVRPLSPVS